MISPLKWIYNLQELQAERKQWEKKKVYQRVMLQEDWWVLARWDTQEELANMKQDMLDSGRFTKYKVKAMIITKNEIK